MRYDIVCGLEIHLQLNTKTKMFSAAPYVCKSEANTCVSATDLSLPGTLPSLNKEAVKKSLALCFALHMDIDTLIRFDRKNYYYPDLPKGYQLTQQFHPLGKDGYIDIGEDDRTRRIRIRRLHMEEDTAKQYHLDERTLIDHNRTGVPLLEIVSEPDIVSAEEAVNYLSKMKQLFEYLGISAARMEDGELRCDVNISLREAGSQELGTKVEIKNINSLSNIRDAIDYEVRRQTQILENGDSIPKETRRFDEKTLMTVLMRKKEDDRDYKFFPDPNIMPVRISEEMLKEVKASLPELPADRIKRYIDSCGLNRSAAELICSQRELSDYYDEALKAKADPKIIFNLLSSGLLGLLARYDTNISACPLRPKDLGRIAAYLEQKKISFTQAKKLIEEVFLNKKDPDELIKDRNIRQLSDEKELLGIIKEVLADNSQSVEDYRKGKERALNYLVGQVIRRTNGQANPELLTALLTNELTKR